LASTSCNERAEELLACCLRGDRPPDELLDSLLAPGCTDALFRVVIERLADLFEPRLCDIYAKVFSEIVARVSPEFQAAELLARYRRVRHPRPFRSGARTVFVLSRVTLGSDVAITSVLLDAAKRRFPEARIVLAGSRKSWELFAGDPRIEHLDIAYRRSGSIGDRLQHWPELARTLSQPDSIVIDPDSRLTQLGLLPVCREENYFFFESRGYGGAGDDSLPELAARWAKEILGIENARRFVAPAEPLPVPGRPLATVSLGVGENPAKRLDESFEQQLVSQLSRAGMHVLIDQGAGGEEAERVKRAIANSTAPRGGIASFCGPFAQFASAIAQSDLYVGYDSAGQHVAAACGVPLISVFAGYPSERFFARWRPPSQAPAEIIPARSASSAQVLERALAFIDRLRAGEHSSRD